MTYSITITLMGLISLNVYLLFFGIILMLGNYFYTVLKEEKMRRLKMKVFDEELRQTGRWN